jgi:hypothetical protein
MPEARLPRPPRYQNYTLTACDLELLRQICEDNAFRYPRALLPDNFVLKAVWNVLAEKHRFKVETAAAHPDGLPYILAVPEPLMRQRGGGGFEDEDHRTPNR